MSTAIAGIADFPAVAEALRIFGDEVYLVGGPVRDLVMGRTPADFDFTTALAPDEIEARIRSAGRRPYIAGKRFGTVAFRHGGETVEVTTFRAERYTAGSRKPDVTFVPAIEQDLARRDFTINAMAMHIIDGVVIDPFGGRDDIAAQVIRAVGDPTERFRDDPLRLLRAARFRAALGFDIDEQTRAAAASVPFEILTVSRERWVGELDKLLVGDHVGLGLQFLAETRLLNYMLPELAPQVAPRAARKRGAATLWDRTVEAVERAPAEVESRWAALLAHVGWPYVCSGEAEPDACAHHRLVGADLVTKIASYLRWSKQRTETVRAAVLDGAGVDGPTPDAD